MPHIVPGRATFDHDGDVVVFLIGMRVNRFRSVRHWCPVFTAMPRMLRELSADRSLGLLGYFAAVQGLRTPTLVQYWRDVDSLLAYAAADDGEHRPAWAAFNRAVREAVRRINANKNAYMRYFIDYHKARDPEIGTLRPQDLREGRLVVVDPAPIPSDELKRTYEWVKSWGMLEATGTPFELVNMDVQNSAHTSIQ